MQRSGLWAKRVNEGEAKASVPTAGEILSALTQGKLGGEKYDAELPQRQRDTLY